MKYADVILPLPLEGHFTYGLTDDLTVSVGCRVIVPLGKNKLYTAIVSRIHEERPQGDYQIKNIIDCIDKKPVVTEIQLKFWQWIAQYYLCTEGDVMKASLPTGMKLESETQLLLNEDFDQWEKLTKKEIQVYEMQQQHQYRNVAQLQKAMKDFRLLGTLRSLMDKGALTVKEELKDAFQPKKEVHIRLCQPYRTESALNQLAGQLEKHPKRYALLMKYLEMSGMPAALTLKNPKLVQEVSRAQLLAEAQVSAAVLTGMKGKGYFETYDFEVGRLKYAGKAVSEQLPLSDAQQKAYDGILSAFNEKRVCLLQGVTSSGKTEIYIRLIRRELEAGRQVLYLLPEIALTTQITQRLKRIFGDKMGVYHSKYPDAERVEIWKKQLSEKPYQLILGVRSSLLLPYRNLGLVIVDEEHETSYKQQDPAPRYNARDAAVVLASLFQARTLLGTATPSLESYYNAQTGKYGYVVLDKRFGDMQLPQIEIVDVQDLQRRRLMRPPFSPRLEEEIEQALENSEQVILFQNRRGYTPVMECRQCGWIPSCQFCDVSLTYHHEQQRLVCHYCGTSYAVPRTCPNCQERDLRSYGFGTEKIEEEVHRRFPEARTARLDLDTTRSRNAYERIIRDFAERKTDILIGTQMVSKGLDFDHVHVVGILDADTILTRPDFRAFERSFQMMSQVAGRAGRRNKRGYVILQTRHADYPVVGQVAQNDFKGMALQNMEERRKFLYPPFCRLIYIYVKHRDDRATEDAAQDMAQILRSRFGTHVLGPDRPAVARIQMMYIRKIMLKVGPAENAMQVRRVLRQAAAAITASPKHKAVSIYFDADPT
ncbi:MAG: primosomal protein N' [Bacteroidaceae bacterium]|nr:primosomal protein N' [Bacteroidaceae bacterium]